MPVGVIPPDAVVTPGVLVDPSHRKGRVDGRQGNHRASRRPGMKAGILVNLGIGLPTSVANYLPKDVARLLPVGERDRRAGHPPARGHG